MSGLSMINDQLFMAPRGTLFIFLGNWQNFIPEVFELLKQNKTIPKIDPGWEAKHMVGENLRKLVAFASSLAAEMQEVANWDLYQVFIS